MLTNEQINDIMEMLNVQLARVDDVMTRLAISSSMSNYLNLYK
jgi:hypothetical protein